MTTAVAAQNLSVCYGAHRALDAVTFDVPPGAVVTILGPNGSGKSTLLKVLLGLLPAAEGDATLFEQPIGAAPPQWVGYVPQTKTLQRSFPALVQELVATGLLRRWPVWLTRGQRSRVQAALERVNAAHLMKRRITALSGGELQRVYLARAIVREPRLIMLDEPATGIDARGEHDFYHLLEHYTRDAGATTLMVTHDWAAAQHHASHVLLLKNRLIAFGEPEAALSEANIAEAFGHVGHVHPHPHGNPKMEHAHA